MGRGGAGALEQRGLAGRPSNGSVVLRSDNGAIPCSRQSLAYLARYGVQGQYTGYDTPDDNGYVERVIRTLKEGEIWPNAYESRGEAHGAIEAYVNYYNQQRIHSALGYLTPDEFAATTVTLAAA